MTNDNFAFSPKLNTIPTEKEIIERLTTGSDVLQDESIMVNYFFNPYRPSNPKNIEKIDELGVLISDFEEKTGATIGNDCFWFEDYGYFSLYECAKGYWAHRYYTKDVESAFFYYVNTALNNASEKDLEKEDTEANFERSFPNSRCAHDVLIAENKMKYWDKYYDGNVPENVINYYERYLKKDENFSFWYDPESKKFCIEARQKTK